ncbi:NACHT domain-containing protein [Pedobacter sp. N23S346]|uniref:NACHT domain-containing protein n=1 Tax=Pedobacter sp. N23S346 TaxID=3402750 RepID=UPI003AD61CB0
MTTQTEITGLIQPLFEAYKLLNAEWKNLFEFGLSDYLHSQTQKFYFTNTFIHRNEKVVFKNIYHPIKASYKKLTADFADIESAFDEYKYITIIGSAGSGKTTLTKYIYLKTIEERKKIPILIELRNLNDYDHGIENLISEKILKTRIKPNDITLTRALQSGKFLFLLDGYDEIFSEKNQEINRQIELFIDTYPLNNYLITTRPGSGIENFPRFYDFKVCELQNEDVTHFITRLVDEEEKRNRIIKTIKENQNYSEYLRNPLLLSMFIMAFENHPEIPKRKSAFYRNVFDTLYSKHDGITKNSFLREKKTKMQLDDFENILSILCYLTLLEGSYDFTHEKLYDYLQKIKTTFSLKYDTDALIHDLRTSISILVLDGFEYRFPHRSMQEYFTAFFISRLPTEKKQKAYSNLATTFLKSSTGDNFTLWSLCLELDENTFLQKFLIPNLQLAQKEFKSGEDLYDVFVKLYDPKLYMNDEQSISNGEIPVYIMQGDTFLSKIIRFAIPFSYVPFWIFPRTKNIEDKLLDVYKEELENFIKAGNYAVKLQNSLMTKDLLMQYGITELIENLKMNLTQKISEFQATIAQKKASIDDLLKL